MVSRVPIRLLPDLGDLTDASKVAGARTGSGAFSAPALRKYVLVGQPVNVKQFGAVGDNVTDDTLAIQAAATSVGYGGALFFPAGSYRVSATITLRGSTKLHGAGPQQTVIERTGDYGDTFTCGLYPNEPAREFVASGIHFRHSAFPGPSDTALANKATIGAHLHLYGTQQALIENCYFTRLPNQVVCEGPSLTRFVRCHFIGVYDPDNVALQEGLANLILRPFGTYPGPVSCAIDQCEFFGTTRTRTVTYSAGGGPVVSPSRADTIGPLYGLLLDGIEDLVVTNSYFGGQQSAQIFFRGAIGAALLHTRISNCEFDGISRGAGILVAPINAGVSMLGLQIENNVFIDQLNSIFVATNLADGLASAHKLGINNNQFMSGIGTPIRLAGAREFSVSGNEITDYNKHALTTSDLAYCAAVLVGPISAHGSIADNRVGGGGNITLNDTATNFCYFGIVVDPACVNVQGGSNTYVGTRTGSNFRTGKSVTENQRVFTAAGNYQMLAGDSVLIVNKTTGAATAVLLPLYPVTGQECVVKDGRGDATTNGINVATGDSTLIDGAANASITTNRGFVRVRFNGAGWDRVG